MLAGFGMLAAGLAGCDRARAAWHAGRWGAGGEPDPRCRLASGRPGVLPPPRPTRCPAEVTTILARPLFEPDRRPAAATAADSLAQRRPCRGSPGCWWRRTVGASSLPGRRRRQADRRHRRAPASAPTWCSRSASARSPSSVRGACARSARHFDGPDAPGSARAGCRQPGPAPGSVPGQAPCCKLARQPACARPLIPRANPRTRSRCRCRHRHERAA